MKRNLLGVALLLCSLAYGVSAQQAVVMPLAQSMTPPAYAVPQTTVKINVGIQKEDIKVGPYARYAQRYLGVIAPLSDKEVYTITGAEISYADPGEQTPAVMVAAATLDGGVPQVLSHTHSESDFPKVLPDKMSATDRSLEDMARDAANTIFTLRRARLDLITGEAGENVFGEGLRAALEEIDRIENEYLSLFLGKQSISTSVKTFNVVPEEGKNNYIVFRFTAEDGLLPENDLSGNPVVLSLTPVEVPASIGPVRGQKTIRYYRLPARMEAVVTDGSDDMARDIIPVYQFGATIAGE